MKRTLAFLLFVLATTARADEIDSLLEQGRVHLQAKNKADAFDCFERVIRNSETFPPKRTAREEIFAMGPFPARDMSDGEKLLVRSRIKDEKCRYFRDVIGRCDGKKWFHAVRLLRLAIVEHLEDSGEVDREKQRIKDLEYRMSHELTPEDKKEYDKAVAASKAEGGPVKASDYWKAKGKLVLACELMREYDYRLEGSDPKRETAKAAIAELEKAILAAVPEAQQKEVDAALKHRVWDGLGTVLSHHFIYIGDKSYISRIPPRSMLELDLAYIFITDLLENNPDADGQRITIFFKELWDFGGGIGGGKTIDIGNVDIKAPNISVSNFLFYHELCHCLFDTAMIYTGFIEGVANFGATFAYDALGFAKEAVNGFTSNGGQFTKDYVGRDLRYWRIQSYGPSAGFWLHFISKYGKAADGTYDWAKYRAFFRLWRRFPLKTDRTVDRIRYFAYCLSQVFGPGVVQDLIDFRFPIVPDELERVRKEVEETFPVFQQGTERMARKDFEGAIGAFREVVEKGGESDLVAQAREQMLHAYEDVKDEPAQAALRTELGLITDWKCCGPFYSDGGTSLHDVFAPEWEIDFAKTYSSQFETAKWFVPKIGYDGVVIYEFHYPANAAAYALTYLDVPTDVDAWIHLGCDDKHAVWVDRELIEKRDTEHGVLFDQDRHPIRLHKGLNKLLVKIANGGGGMAFQARVTDRKGRAIPSLRAVTDERETGIPPAPAFKPGKRLFLEEFHNKATLAANWTTGCGSWKVQNKRLVGLETRHNALWRKFLVTPGQEKDSPANMLWLKPKHAGEGRDLQIELDLAMNGESRPKFTVTLDGEGENDGLSGLTLIFLPFGEGVDVRLEWYDKIMFFRRVKPKAAKEWKLAVSRQDGYVSVTLNETPVFDRISLPVLRSTQIGFATFGLEPAITRFCLTAAGK